MNRRILATAEWLLRKECFKHPSKFVKSVLSVCLLYSSRLFLCLQFAPQLEMLHSRHKTEKELRHTVQHDWSVTGVSHGALRHFPHCGFVLPRNDQHRLKHRHWLILIKGDLTANTENQSEQICPLMMWKNVRNSLSQSTFLGNGWDKFLDWKGAVINRQCGNMEKSWRNISRRFINQEEFIMPRYACQEQKLARTSIKTKKDFEDLRKSCRA